MSTQATLSERLVVPPKTLEDFCRRWHIVRLEVFGSVLRDDFDAQSDVDFLASFDRGEGPSGFDWFQFKEELAQIVGRRIDVLDRRVVEQSRNLYRRHHILREATPIHGS